MKNILFSALSFIYFLVILIGNTVNAQVSINSDNSTPNPAAILDLKSSDKGFLPPRMTRTEMNSIVNPPNGLIVYCTDCGPNGSGAITMVESGAWHTLNSNCLNPLEPDAGNHIPTLNEIIWNWNPVQNAAGYKWNTENNYSTAIDIGTITSYLESGLSCLTTYTRFVWTYSSCGISGSRELNKTTASETITSPLAGNHVPSVTQIQWNWNSVPGALGYKWNIINDLNSAFDLGMSFSKLETQLECNTDYTRFLWAYNPCGTSTSTILTQKTLSIPVLPPNEGIHITTSTQIIWNWNPVADAMGYKWNVTSDFNTAVEIGSLTSFTENNLTCNTAYTRYIWAYNNCEYSVSTTLNQTTSACPMPCDPLIDNRDGKTYYSILIGNQCWLSQNLNIGTMINGSSQQKNNGVIEKYCYNNLESNCNIYGGLYQWGEMVQYINGTTNSSSWNPVPIGNIIGICPTGWHLPSEAEWLVLQNYLGGTDSAGGKMKETGYDHWFAPNTGATNESGFTGFGGGIRTDSPIFAQLKYWGHFASSTEVNENERMKMFLDRSEASAWVTDDWKIYGLSVRCIKN